MCSTLNGCNVRVSSFPFDEKGKNVSGVLKELCGNKKLIINGEFVDKGLRKVEKVSDGIYLIECGIDGFRKYLLEILNDSENCNSYEKLSEDMKEVQEFALYLDILAENVYVDKSGKIIINDQIDYNNYCDNKYIHLSFNLKNDLEDNLKDDYKESVAMIEGVQNVVDVTMFNGCLIATVNSTRFAAGWFSAATGPNGCAIVNLDSPEVGFSTYTLRAIHEIRHYNVSLINKIILDNSKNCNISSSIIKYFNALNFDYISAEMASLIFNRQYIFIDFRDMENVLDLLKYQTAYLNELHSQFTDIYSSWFAPMSPDSVYSVYFKDDTYTCADVVGENFEDKESSKRVFSYLQLFAYLRMQLRHPIFNDSLNNFKSRVFSDCKIIGSILAVSRNIKFAEFLISGFVRGCNYLHDVIGDSDVDEFLCDCVNDFQYFVNDGDLDPFILKLISKRKCTLDE